MDWHHIPAIARPNVSEATTVFFKGSSIAPNIVTIFERHADPGPYLPKPQTLWSAGAILRFRCNFYT